MVPAGKAAVSDEGDVDRRLAELEEVLDREAAAARRAVDAPATEGEPEPEKALEPRRPSPPPAPRAGFAATMLKLAVLGVATIVAVRVVAVLFLAPIFGALALAWTVAKLALLGGVVYGLWSVLGSKPDPAELEK